MSKIYFHDLKISGLQKRRLLKDFISYLFRKERSPCQQLDVIFCSDEYLLRLNKNFLNHNYYTDTMAFPLSTKPLVGEIYISIDRVKENSKKLKIFYQEELLRVIFHSCLHLCGYKDDSSWNIKRMLTKQEEYLSEWLVSRETRIGGYKGFE